jgi:GT2 family glycosyltransferase
VEVVLVDNASSDDSVSYASGRTSRVPLRIIENDENLSFSAANNAAVADSDAELILFLNNDIRPMEPNWLGWMVESVMRPGTAACGARLIVPRRPAAGRSTAAQADLELQHVGIHFDWADGMPIPRNLGGPDPAAPELVVVTERPAATAACLLVRRDSFMDAGGFDPEYVYGYEDIDLCLRLGDLGGRIVVDGRAALWHDESATRRRSMPANVRRQRLNRETFYARWGRRLFREVLLERLDGGGPRSRIPPSCAIAWLAGAEDDASGRSGEVGAPAGTRPAATGLADALAADGWEATALGVAADPTNDERLAALAVDILVSTHPGIDVRGVARHVIRVAWIAGPADEWVASSWIDDFDLILVDDDAAAAAIRDGTSHVAQRMPDGRGNASVVATGFIAAIRRWIEARRFAILIQVDDWERAETSGDYHFARALQRQLERRGIPTAVHFRPEWKQPVSTRSDVAIHLWGRYPLGRRPGQVSVLWILYHPELVTDDLLEEYDLILVASDRFARSIAGRAPAPVAAVHQATDPERFRPGLPGPRHDLLFVGNSRGVRRAILDDLTPTTHDLAVYGGGWPPDLLDPAYLRGSAVPNEELPGYYGSAAIVLNDHWQETARSGFLNNRLYDALAAGGFVVSDAVEGLAEEFDDGVVAYSDPADLFGIVERYLVDPDARAERAARGRAAVLERHTFSHRADEILALIDAVPDARPPLRLTPPTAGGPASDPDVSRDG